MALLGLEYPSSDEETSRSILQESAVTAALPIVAAPDVSVQVGLINTLYRALLLTPYRIQCTLK